MYKLTMVFSLAAVRLLGQVCVLSPDMQGGSQYNQPQPLVANYLGQNVPVAWPRSAEVYYVEFEGTYNGYYTYFPSDYGTSAATAYSNWEGASSQDNSLLTFSYYGVTDQGLNSVSSQANPDFQPWHQWTVVNQSDHPSGSTLAVTSWAFENYGSNQQPVWRIGTAYTRVTNAMSQSGDSQNWEAHTFAHELGHTMALSDCMLCAGGPGGTVMAYLSSFLDHSSLPISGPQYCDLVQTQQTAYPY